MDFIDMLPKVADLMTELQPVPSGRYFLMLEKKDLKISPALPPNAKGVTVWQFTATDINTGLTGKQWNNLLAKLRILHERGEL